MLNKNELEKIVINSAEELKVFEGQDLNGKYLVLNEIIKDIKLGTLEDCVIEGGGLVCKKLSRCNLYEVSYTYADEIYLSVLQRCKKVQCGSIEDNHSIKASQFFCCGDILIDDATVEDCVFDNFEMISPTCTTMSNCIIANIVCDKECVINMEDGELTNISFENIELRNGSYLIDGYGNPWVEKSVFANIRTSREDHKIFHMEETRGKIFKKKVEFSFVDEESCCGLDLIAKIKDNSINVNWMF